MGSLWSGRECVYSRWWMSAHQLLANSRAILILYFVIMILQNAHSKSEELTNYGKVPNKVYYAEMDVSYIDPETKDKMKTHIQGKYGLSSVIRQVSGVLMHVLSKSNGKSSKTDHTGCTEYVNGKFPRSKWIAVVERGECTFTDKVRIATKIHNASAVVIYYKTGEQRPFNTDKDINSVSVYVNFKDSPILKLLDQGVKIRMKLVPGEPVPHTDNMQHSISKTSVLFVSVSFIVLMVVSLAWLIFYYIQRFRYSHAKERLARLLVYAARKATAKIPQKTVKAGDKELEGDFDQCAVCIEQYKPHDVIRILPCRHVFHKSCIDPWLLDQRSCPMCKLDILRYYGMQVSSSQESVHRDPESGPVTQVVTDDPPEVRFNVEDTQAEILLVPPPPTWLQMHPAGGSTALSSSEGGAPVQLTGEEEVEEHGLSIVGGTCGGVGLATTAASASSSPPSSSLPSPSSSAMALVEADSYDDEDDITTLLPSASTTATTKTGNSTSNVSRAQKRDKEESPEGETAALISGSENKRQLSVDDDSMDAPSSSLVGANSGSLQGSSEMNVSVEVNHESCA